MKSATLSISFSFLLLILFSCSNSSSIKTIGQYPQDCITPDMAITKLQQSDEGTVVAAIFAYAEQNDIVITEPARAVISNWIKNTVFSNASNNKSIREWNINDEDICTIQRQKITAASDTNKVQNTEIKICNTVLTEDVSSGSFWVLNTDDFTINISFCFNPIEYIKPVGYYKIVESSGVLKKSMTTTLRKYYTAVDINLDLWDVNNHTKYQTQLLSEEGLLYTSLANWDKKRSEHDVKYSR